VHKIWNFLAEESGASAAEYGLILALVAVVIVGGLTFLGNAMNDVFNRDASAINSTSS
jgi:pilus assembly protein Flp/PilA